jgi:glucose-6-phosphate isomerase
MLDLSAAAGLPVSLDLEACRLVFHPPLSAVQPATRPAEQLRAVYRHPAAVDEFARDGLYYMYDGVALPQHRETIQRAGLRYDLTLLRQGVAGDEPIKTLGHYHTLDPDGLPYPELYQVAYGCAHFVLQLAHAPKYGVEKVVVVEAQAGELVLMPPGWGHVSINAGDGPLVMCNWIAASCATVPEPYLACNGAACYEARGEHGLTPEPNPRYGIACPAEVKRAAPEVKGFIGPGPIYATGIANLDALRPLVQPSAFDWPQPGRR